MNGVQCGYVRYRRGLKQGDSLSPFHFVLAIDVLSMMFSHALNLGILNGVPIRENGRMCNLQYAEHLLLLTTGGIEDLGVIKLILFIFKGMSGLTINFTKTCLYSTRSDQLLETMLTNTLSCSTSFLPLTYPNVPISGR